MKQSLRRAGALLWWLVAGSVIAAALLLGLARLVLPAVGGYRSDVERWLSDYLQRPVTVERLDVRWAGFGPQLTLRGLRIADPAGEVLLFGVDEAYVDTNLLRFLLGGVAALRDVELNGFRLQVDIRVDGSVAVQGVELWRPGAARAVGDPAALLAALFTGPRRIALSGVSVVLRDWREDRSYRLDGATLRLLSTGERRLLQADIPLALALGGHLRVSVELDAANAAIGSLFLAMENLRLQPLGHLLRDLPLRPASGAIDGELWLGWDEGGLQRLEAKLELRDTTLSSAAQTWRGRRIAGELGWRRLDDGWHLQVENLRLRTATAQWPVARGQLRLHVGGAARALEGAWSYLDLGELARLAELAQATGLALPVMQQLLPWQPRGEVHDLRFHLPLDAAGAPTALDARVAALGARAHAGAPGFEGLSGQLQLRGARGRLDLASGDFGITFTDLFRAPLRAQALAGSVGLDVADGITLWSPHVLLANEHLHSESRFIARWTAREPLFVDFQARFRDGDGRAVSRYLPVGIMHPRLVRWLDESLPEGRVREGEALLYGPLARFPFRDGDGVFQVQFEAADVRLEYQRGWPPARDISASVRFAQVGLDVRVREARLLGATVREARARFDDLSTGVLQLEGDVDAEMPQLLRFVRESPLRETLGVFFSGAHGAGPARVALALRLPVNAPDDLSVTGRVALDGAQLHKPAFNLDFDQLRGEVRFTRAGIGIESLRGRLNQRPVDIRAGPLAPGRAAAAGTRISLNGAFSPRELLGPRLRGLTAHLRGRAPWAVEVDLWRPGAVVVRARSQLQGLAVELPAPLAKPAPVGRAFNLELGFADAGARLAVSFRYGALLRGELELIETNAGMALHRGRLTSAAELPPPDAEAGLVVDFDLASVDLDGWLRLIAAWPRDPGTDTNLRRLSLRAEQALFNQHPIGALTLTAFRAAGNWVAGIVNPAVTGSLEVPRVAERARPVRVNLQRVDLGALLAGGNGAGAGLELQPEDVPPLRLQVAMLRWGDTRIRDLRVSATPHPRHLSLDEVSFDTGALQLTGQGDWRLTGTGRHQSRIEFTLRSEDWGAGLDELGYPGLLRAGRGDVNGELGWGAPLYRPALAEMQGSIGLRVRDGSLLDAEPGLGRVVGLFSIQALPRRLALDFKDFVSEGFEFDQLQGSVELVDGTAHTREMRLQGTVGRIEVTGSSNLIEQTYAQEVVVTPNLSASLPLVGELAVPGSGLTVLLLGTVLKGLGLDIERLGQLQYTLTGPWATPVIERKQVQVDSPRDEVDKR